MNILFLCTGNSCRSILAEGTFNHLAPAGWKAMSAGSKPTGEVHPRSLALLVREGISTEVLHSKSWDNLPLTPDVVITVCSNAAGETCPAYLGRAVRSHWGVEDPAHATGTDAEIDAAFMMAYRTLRARIEAFLALPLAELQGDPQRLNAELGRIGTIAPTFKRSLNMNSVKDIVKEKYGETARRVATGSVGASCCGAEACCDTDPITSGLYDEAQKSGLPEKAILASLGCGNPTALAELRPGETVLDLGSGGGIDVLLSAKRVGPTGKAYGLDMTDDMLALARENQKKAGVENVEFLKGEIENIPLPDNSVDVIISNCVINLSADKDRVLREAFRVLKPGGRFGVSDVVVRGKVPEEVRKNMLLWVGCIAGALEDDQYAAKLATAGFQGIEIEPTRIYSIEDARTFLSGEGIDVDAMAPAVDGKFMSAFVRATKPANAKRRPTIQVFDPALCCSTGVCGVEVDQALVNFSADAAWAKLNGAQIERFNLAQQPMAFAESAAAKSFLERSGPEALPLVLVNGEVALAGRYPNRAELARWAGILPVATETKPAGSCCSGSKCC